MPASRTHPRRAQAAFSTTLASPSSASARPAKEPKTKAPAAFPVTPYPELEAPTHQQCEEVHARLVKMHGRPVRNGPGKLLWETGEEGVNHAPTTSSLNNQRPSVLSVTVRTILSQNTNTSNSDRAFASLLNTYGHTSIGEKSVDLVNMYRSTHEEVVESIACGGLHHRKGKILWNLVQDVHRRNKTRRKEDSTWAPMPPIGQAASKEEISRTDDEALLTLDYLYDYPEDKAMEHLQTYNGIGPKTASCVVAYTLGHDLFAVDTHCLRLAKMLDWVPQNATAQSAYEHLDVRIPNELKYSMHFLFIAHGRHCPRCAAKPEPNQYPPLGPCPLVDLSDHTKGRKETKVRRAKKNAKGVKEEEEEEE